MHDRTTGVLCMNITGEGKRALSVGGTFTIPRKIRCNELQRTSAAAPCIIETISLKTPFCGLTHDPWPTTQTIPAQMLESSHLK